MSRCQLDWADQGGRGDLRDPRRQIRHSREGDQGDLGDFNLQLWVGVGKGEKPARSFTGWSYGISVSATCREGLRWLPRPSYLCTSLHTCSELGVEVPQVPQVPLASVRREALR
jgi:hypothetical protein